MNLTERIFRSVSSFRSKQRLVIMLACFVVLSATMICFLLHSLYSFNEESRERLSALSDIVGADIGAALSFGDEQAINKSLAVLGGDPSIKLLLVMNEQKHVSAYYFHQKSEVAPDDQRQLQKTLHSRANQHVFDLSPVVERPVIRDGIRLGTIIIEQSEHIIIKKIIASGIISFFVLIFSLVLSFMLADRFQRIITGPITAMAAAMQEVSHSKDYSKRVAVSDIDEMNQLAESFNEMLSEISERDEALLDSQFRWKFAIEGSGDGVWDWNLLTGEAKFSKRWKEMLGYEEDEIQPASQEWRDRIHPDDLSYVSDSMQAYLEGRAENCFIEYRLRCKDENYKWILGRGIVVSRSDCGKPLRMIGTNSDITGRKKSEEKINYLAFFDQLTGLPNRTLLQDRLRQAMSASSRSGGYGALLYIDLDNFKSLNDTLGHDMGDLLLKQVAQRLSTSVRAEDTTARLGGDEFVVMLSNLSQNEKAAARQTEVVGLKILAALNQIYHLDNVPHHSTPSIGAILFSGNQTEMDVLLKQADIAMYRSKDSGRNTLRFFDPDMETVVMERAAMEKDLRIAVQKRQFILHYQPQMAGGQLSGSEALVRWQHPQRGMVSPVEFIPLAEETGLILFLGQWVLETACTQLAAWATRPEMEHLTIAVNVSARQFQQINFVEQVLEVLQITGANPQRLKLELTESMLVSNVEEIIEKMFSLKAKGVGFSLDDFGTGYSSLSYLKRLPLDQLKIDQSFVRDVLIDPNDAAIAKTVIALAHGLGLGVIAEGVETSEQRDFLASSGCHAYQGYLFSRPLHIESFEEFARGV